MDKKGIAPLGMSQLISCENSCPELLSLTLRHETHELAYFKRGTLMLFIRCGESTFVVLLLITCNRHSTPMQNKDLFTSTAARLSACSSQG